MEKRSTSSPSGVLAINWVKNTNMKLHQHFIINFLAIFGVMLLFSTLVSYFAIKESNLQEHKNAIATHMKIIKTHLEHESDIDAYAKEIKEKTGLRFTLIDDDGIVLAESNYDKTEMDNHQDRKEVLQARAQKSGFAVRHSDTIEKDMLYMASQFYWQKKPVFIRLAQELQDVQERFLDIWLKILLVLITALAMGMYIFYKLSKKIQKEIIKITTTLDEISNKEYKATVNASFAQEFHDIESHISKLAKKLEKRAKQKRKYNAKIRFISKQRSDIISAISHEFKNPIASVMGYAQTLLEDPNTDASIRERFLEKIVKNSQKISTMIDRLSLATKFENGDLSPQKTDFDLYALCVDVVNSFKDKYPERQFRFVGENSKVFADKTMIELVVVNLIDNAIKYSEMDIFILLENNTLHIQDKGVGINQDEIEKVTQKFYRSDTLTWDNSMGLGLALVKYILSLHESELHIKSNLGEGSDFYFSLEK